MELLLADEPSGLFSFAGAGSDTVRKMPPVPACCTLLKNPLLLSKCLPSWSKASCGDSNRGPLRSPAVFTRLFSRVLRLLKLLLILSEYTAFAVIVALQAEDLGERFRYSELHALGDEQQ